MGHSEGQPDPQSASKPRRVVIPSLAAKAHALQHRMVEDARAAGFSNEDCFAIQLALDEALANAIKHGNCDDPDKKVAVEYHVDASRFEARVRDEGCGFDPEDVPDPTAEENLNRPHGRGVLLMRAYMDEVSYSDRGRCVHLVRTPGGPAARPCETDEA